MEVCKLSSIFLSHSHADKGFVNRIAKDLRSEGYYVWTDDAEIKVGDSLIQKIREGIDKVAFVGAVISKNSIESEWVKKELDIAMNQEIDGKNIKVFPILIDNVPLPGFLLGKKYADFRNGDMYDNSLSEIKARLDEVPTKDKSISPDEAQVLAQRLTLLEKRLSMSDKERELILERLALERKEINSRLKLEIKKESKIYPELEDINRNFAFELEGIPVTAGYVLHSIRKERIKGGPHQLVILAEVLEKTEELSLLVKAIVRRLGRF